MIEKKIRKSLLRVTIIICILSFCLMTGGSAIYALLENAQRDTIRSQLMAETKEYKIHILKQLDADLQTLNTLVGFMEFGIYTDRESFARGLEKSNANNRFISMGYYGKSGTSIRVTLEEDIEIGSWEELPQELQEVIAQGLRGEEVISDIYYDEELDQEMIVVGVPIYDGEEVIGVLTAGDDVQEFKEFLQPSGQAQPRTYTHLMDSEGNFLIRSDYRLVPEDMDSLFGGENHFKDEDAIREALKNGESYQTDYEYKGTESSVYFEPVGINGWYLFCVDTFRGGSGSAFYMLKIARFTFVGILTLVMVFIIYVYRKIRKNQIYLANLAYFDPLTGAYNLAHFQEECDELLQKSDDYSMVMFNIRQFQFINEIFGTYVADDLLRHMQKTIAGNLGEGETYCRENDDQFIGLFKETDKKRLMDRVQKITDEISGLSAVYKRNYQIQIYAGIVMGPREQGDSCISMMNQSRFALKQAKRPGIDRAFYDGQAHKQEQIQNYVESHKQKALAKGEFQLYLQPKIDLKSGKLSGAEALVRWLKADGTMLFPDNFIPLFEQNGFCVKLDLYMFEKVCLCLKNWKDAGIPVLPISINQSKLLFYESDYVEKLCEITEKYQVSPEWITLEVLEGLAAENIEELNATIERLHEKGFRVSMDDFGNGYSSLNTLSGLHIDELKLDRMFLLGMKKENADRQALLMEYVVKLAKAMNVTTVVEGVETKENEELIKRLDCDFGQGYLYSRPIPLEEFIKKYGMKPDKL